MKATPPASKLGFSFVEILLTIAVIGILSALAVPFIAGLTGDSAAVVARQQQAELQTALGNWIVATSSQPGGLAAARSAYSGDKLALLRDYLQESTYDNLTWNGTNVTSGALDAANAYLRFSSWSATNQPVVEWINR